MRSSRRDTTTLTYHLAQPEHHQPLLLPQRLDAEEDADREGDGEEEVTDGGEEMSEYSEEKALLGLLVLLPWILDVHEGRVTVGLLQVGVSEGALVAERVVLHGLL